MSENRSKLTDAKVAALEVPLIGERTTWDEDPKAFGVRVSHTGSKTFMIRYRIGRGGKQRWLSIGRHRDPWLVEDARLYARELLIEASKGNDPKAGRAKRRGIPTVEAWSKTFLETHGKTMKASSLATVEILVRKHIVPAFGAIRLDQLRKEDVLALYRRLVAKGAGPSANRVTATLHSMIERAREQDKFDGPNPAAIPKTAKHEEPARKRYLSADEWKRLGEALEAAETDGEDKYFLAAVKLLCLTGARAGEIFNLRWDQVDLAAKTLVLDEHKTSKREGSKTIVLSDAAVQVLKLITRKTSNPFVICGHRRGASYKGESKAWQRLRERAGLGDARLHDLRHSYASTLVNEGTSLPLIGKLLGHRQASTTQRYAHVDESPQKAATELAARSIGRALKVTKAVDDIPPPEPVTTKRRFFDGDDDPERGTA